MTVQQLLNSITSSEITEWIAYLNLKNSPASGDGKGAKDALTAIFSTRLRKKGKDGITRDARKS